MSVATPTSKSQLPVAPNLDWLEKATLKLDRALDRASGPPQTADPTDIATRALHTERATPESLQRKQQEQLMFDQPGTKTARALAEVIDSQENAAIKLSTLGYQNVRHLRAKGLLMVEIARDLGINVNDLMAYMRLHPNAHEDALQDEETCADARTVNLDEWIESYAVMSKFDSEKLKLRTQIQLEMNKRLSAKWALRTDKDLLAAQQSSHLSVVIGAPVDNNKQKTLGGKTYNPEDHGPLTSTNEDGRFEMVITGNNDDRNRVVEDDGTGDVTRK